MALRRSCSGSAGKGTALALAAVLTLTLTSCGDDEDSGTADGGRTKVTVAALPLVDSAMLYIAQDRGLFEKEGLDVRIQQSLQALPPLSKGQIDMVASANYVTYFQAQDKGTHDIDESVYVGDRVVVLSPGPGSHIVLDLPVGLPGKRDQIGTRGLPEFVALRAEVGRAVRGGQSPLNATSARHDSRLQP